MLRSRWPLQRGVIFLVTGGLDLLASVSALNALKKISRPVVAGPHHLRLVIASAFIASEDIVRTQWPVALILVPETPALPA